ncbi:MAG TPA: ice-binding family protein, partial [Gammaproteobacteria bacterium]|nr:ice-binding family protein [Gammaproteobacteria bacterium]
PTGTIFVTGTSFNAALDPTRTAALADLAAAHTTLAGMPHLTYGVLIVALTGTYTSGSYEFTAPTITSASTVTLQGPGKFIFYFGINSLDIIADTQIILTNGAKAEDVYWVFDAPLAPPSLTIDGGIAGGTLFVGNILADGAVTMDMPLTPLTPASVFGRILNEGTGLLTDTTLAGNAIVNPSASK